MNSPGGRALDGLGVRIELPNPEELCGSHTVGANVHCEEGNNPDLQLRSPSYD
jgi:hypothetical protein